MDPQPAGEKPALSMTGGARLGMFNATWPFARLTADPKTLKLSVLGKAIVFPRERVIELIAMKGFITHGLEIRHAQDSYPSRIIFWTFSPSALRAGLESIGWRVS
jgi:hypothetical protein